MNPTNPVLYCLARFHAKRIVKQRLIDQGTKLQTVKARDITEAANGYIQTHPECFELAAETIRRSPLLQRKCKSYE